METLMILLAQTLLTLALAAGAHALKRHVQLRRIYAAAARPTQPAPVPLNPNLRQPAPEVATSAQGRVEGPVIEASPLDFENALPESMVSTQEIELETVPYYAIPDDSPTTVMNTHQLFLLRNLAEHRAATQQPKQRHQR